MRRVLLILAIVAAAAILAAPADAGKRSGQGPSGIDGTVFNSTCPGPCIYPPPPQPQYTGGGLTVQIRRAGDGTLVESLNPTDGHFRVRVRRGFYDVSASIAQPQPAPQPQGNAAIPQSCWQGDSQRVQVRRHRFTRVALHVQNACIV